MAEEQQMRIGLASTSITPPCKVQLLGQFHERISTHVRDEVTATALALETTGPEGDAAIIISCDLVCVPKIVLDKLRASLSGRLAGCDPTKIFAAATHTHTAPALPAILDYPEPPEGVMTTGEYVEFLVERLAQIATAAWNGRKPGGVSWTVGHAALGFNRRVVYKNGQAQMYGDTSRDDFCCLEGAEDHGVELLYLWDSNNSLTGVVINPACPSQVAEGQNYVSADFWAAARKRLREVYGQELQVVPLTSAAGDQSPRDLVRRGRGEADMRDEPGLEELGSRVAEMVERGFLKAQRKIKNNLAVRHISKTIHLPLRVPTQDELQQATATVEQLKAGNPASGTTQWGQLNHWRNALERVHAYDEASKFSMELHVLRIGDVVFCTNPFELFLDFGLQMKARSKAEQTFVVQLACDAGGYVPTQRAVEGGSYGAMIWNGDVGPEGGDALVTETLNAINSVLG